MVEGKHGHVSKSTRRYALYTSQLFAESLRCQPKAIDIEINVAYANIINLGGTT